MHDKNTARTSGIPVEVLTTAEIMAIETEAHRSDAPTELMILLMLHAGLRVGEVAALRWEHIGTVELTFTGIRLTADITKTKTAREIPMTPALRAARARLEQLWITRKTEPNHTDFCFPYPGRKTHITVRAIEMRVSRVSITAIGRHIHPHVLRHTFANELRRVTDLPTIQLLLGHTMLSSTQIYLHPDTNDTKSAIEKAFDPKFTDRGITPR